MATVKNGVKQYTAEDIKKDIEAKKKKLGQAEIKKRYGGKQPRVQ